MASPRELLAIAAHAAPMSAAPCVAVAGESAEGEPLAELAPVDSDRPEALAGIDLQHRLGERRLRRHQQRDGKQRATTAARADHQTGCTSEHRRNFRDCHCSTPQERLHFRWTWTG